MSIKITKGGKGPIGSKVKAKNGKYVHERKASPNKDAEYYTIKKGGKLLRIMKSKGKSKVQSVLIPVKKGKK